MHHICSALCVGGCACVSGWMVGCGCGCVLVGMGVGLCGGVDVC